MTCLANESARISIHKKNFMIGKTCCVLFTEALLSLLYLKHESDIVKNLVGHSSFFVINRF